MLDLRIRLDSILQPYINRYYTGSVSSLFTLPPRNSNADFSLPCFILSKAAKIPPGKIAQSLAEEICPDDLIKNAFAMGPYLNFNIDTKLLLADFIDRLKIDDPFIPDSEPNERDKGPILIEYSQPNTHKLFHIGHIRNVVIGDSLSRIYRYNRYNVVCLNYIGDIGAHIARFLWFFLKKKKDISKFQDGIELGRLYIESSLYLENLTEKDNKEAKREISEIQQALEDRTSEDLLNLWKITREQSLSYFNNIYSLLNAVFDRYYFESEVEQEGIRLIKEYFSKGIFKRSQGALVINLGEKLDTFLVLKSDGTSLYSTKDIALAYKKQQDYNPVLSLYVVGSEQILYFRQLFETLRKMGFSGYDKLRHLSYELVTLKDEKMSSRYGNIVSFHDLWDAICDKIESTYIESREWGREQKKDTLYRIALATIRYGMLSNSPGKKLTFNLEDWLKPEGDTGAYILYTIARINSILSKSPAIPAEAICNTGYVPHPVENGIIINLSEFNNVIRLAQEKLDPSLPANYIANLCREFNKFYHQFPVNKARESEYTFRYFLITAIKTVLEKGVSLLGFSPVSRM